MEDAGDALHGLTGLRRLQSFLRGAVVGIETQGLMKILRSSAEVAVFDAAIASGGELLRTQVVVGGGGRCARRFGRVD